MTYPITSGSTGISCGVFKLCYYQRLTLPAAVVSLTRGWGTRGHGSGGGRRIVIRGHAGICFPSINSSFKFFKTNTDTALVWIDKEEDGRVKTSQLLELQLFDFKLSAITSCTT